MRKILGVEEGDRILLLLLRVDPSGKIVLEKALIASAARYPNSFHIEPYIFDNESEKRLFKCFVEHKEIEEIYYTGGITDAGHNEFYVEYYDELEGRWRRYYPDFILKLKNNGWAVVEVKQADQTAHPNVVAKEQAARELFEKLNSIHYIIKRDDEIHRGMFQDIIAAGSSNG